MRLCRSPRKALLKLASSRRCCGTAPGYCYVTDLPGAVGIRTSGTCPVGTWSPGNCPARHLLEELRDELGIDSCARRTRCHRVVYRRCAWRAVPGSWKLPCDIQQGSCRASSLTTRFIGMSVHPLCCRSRWTPTESLDDSMLIGSPVKPWPQVVLVLTNSRAEPASEVVPKAANVSDSSCLPTSTRWL